MNTPVLIKTFVKDGAIAPYRICAVGSVDQTAKQAAAATAPPIGISNRLGAPDSGDLRVDVICAGMFPCEAGATITRGAAVMADSNGKAIDATAGKFAVGTALAAASAGDLVPVQIGIFQIANAAA